MNNPKFQLFRDVANEFRFRLRARNGEIILQSSEGYNSRQGCKDGISSVKVNAPYSERYSKQITPGGQYTFMLKAANNLILARSESYTLASSRDEGHPGCTKNRSERSSRRSHNPTSLTL